MSTGLYRRTSFSRSKNTSKNLKHCSIIDIFKLIVTLEKAYYRLGDINVYQQGREIGLLICLNEPLHCPMALLYEMLREFQKYEPLTNHEVLVHCQQR